jgi:hypothetical protein
MRAFEGCRKAQAKNKQLLGERIRLVVLRPIIGELCEKNPLKDEVRMCAEILTESSASMLRSHALLTQPPRANFTTGRGGI